jgi:predicted MPP superfamily phosphohydrolase
VLQDLQTERVTPSTRATVGPMPLVSPPDPRPHAPVRPAPARANGANLVGQDPFISAMWAVHPCPIFNPRNKRGPWFQFRVPYGFEWNRVQLPVPNLPRALEGLRILHVTDFHLHRFWKEPYDELLRRIAADEPDLLLSGGDYVEDKLDHRPALPMALRMVRGFRAKLGVFGILGNHDLHRMAPHLRRTPMDLIDGARREIPFGDDGTVIEIIGLPGVDRDELTDEFLYSIPRRRENTLRVVLSHHPDHFPRVRYALEPDLFLAGHTHGGQVCLPGGYPILRHDSSPRRLCTGIHWIERTWMVVNRGFGFSGMPVRLFCPAEVLDLRLTRMT